MTFEAGHCPTCGVLRESTLTHIISGEENFLHRTLASVGVPPLHIVKAQNGVQYRFYELTGDLPGHAALSTFREHADSACRTTRRRRAGEHVKGHVHLKESAAAGTGRVRLQGLTPEMMARAGVMGTDRVTKC